MKQCIVDMEEAIALCTGGPDIESQKRGREQHIKSDTSFHLELAKACQSKYLERIIRTMNVQMEHNIQCATDDYVKPEEFIVVLDEHKKIANAVSSKDGDLARDAMAHHVVASLKRITRCGGKQN